MARYYAGHAATTQMSHKKPPRGVESSMRLIAALAGALLACALPPTASATDERTAAGDSDGSSVIGSGGVFALLDSYGHPYLVGLQYRGAPRTDWSLRPGIGLLAGENRMSYLYADLAHDFALPRQWFATLSFGFGWFDNGDAIDVVDAREFQTVVAVSRRLASGARIGLSASHISNGGLSSPNGGTETLAVFFARPVRPSR
jgi:hypothetical protein